jgi:hypothetical protein
MRFMVIVKATKNSETGAKPNPELLTEMGRFNQELAKAGVLLAGKTSSQLEGRASPVLGREADCN